MNSYQGAKRIEKYLRAKHADVIKDRNGDGRIVMGKKELRRTGMDGWTGGPKPALIIWEGYYDWTHWLEVETMQSILDRHWGNGLMVSKNSEWCIEVYQIEREKVS